MYHYFRKPFPQNAHTDKLLVGIRKAAEEYRELPILTLTYSEFHLFRVTGSRVEYEASYIDHRRRVNVLTLMALAEPERDWLEYLEDALWAICDEYTWALPAHVRANATTAEAVTELDLFASETAGMLADILDLLGEKLSPQVYDRIDYELRRRIMVPFLTREPRFYKNNWSAVTGAGAAMTVMRLGTLEEGEKAIAIADRKMADFLESYYDDGCCMEGPLYWRYGFGYFVYYAAMVRDYTQGKIDWFRDGKVRAVAEFSNYFYLQDNHVLPFADAPHQMNFHIGLTHFLAGEYDTMSQPEERFEVDFGDDPRHRFVELIRDFYWHDPESQPRMIHCAARDFPDAKWCIRRQEKLVLAAKGGHNKEPHNHNDLGSFILFDDGKFILDDLGWPEYDLWYFSEKRPTYLCAGSHGHNLPIIAGNYQKSGAEFRAEILNSTEQEIEFDISGAYGLPGVRVLRKLRLADGVLTVRDSYHGCAGMELRERFVTRILPEVGTDFVRISDWRITADKAAHVEHSTDTFEPRLSCCKMDMEPVETAQLLDFVFTPDCDDWTVEFTVKK